MLTRYMYVHFFLKLLTHWEFSDSLYLHIQVYVCYFTDQVFREDNTYYV